MHDPWDGAFRTEVSEFPSTVMCSAFRTFQGWTALSDMQPDQGVLHAVPIPAAMAYLLLRALQDDVAADDLCGAVNGQAMPITDRYHSVLLQALTPIPAGAARRYRVVARRLDPLGRRGQRPAGMGQRHVHPGRAVLREERGLRSVPAARRSSRAPARPTSPPSTTRPPGPAAPLSPTSTTPGARSSACSSTPHGAQCPRMLPWQRIPTSWRAAARALQGHRQRHRLPSCGSTPRPPALPHCDGGRMRRPPPRARLRGLSAHCARADLDHKGAAALAPDPGVRRAGLDPDQ